MMLQVKLEKPTQKNSYQIKLTQGHFAIVDNPPDPCLFLYRWRTVLWNYRYYAYSSRTCSGKHCSVSMHRLIATTPKGEVCHHYNRNSLDNRLANLLNITNLHHRQLHKIRKFGRKNDNSKHRV